MTMTTTMTNRRNPVADMAHDFDDLRRMLRQWVDEGRQDIAASRAKHEALAAWLRDRQPVAGIMGLVIHNEGVPGGWIARHAARRATAKAQAWPTAQWYGNLLRDPEFKKQMSDLRAPTNRREFMGRWNRVCDALSLEDDLTRQQIATRFHVSLSTISRWATWYDRLVELHDRGT